MKSTQPIEFTQKEFLNEKYRNYSVESIGKMNGIIYFLENGIYAVSYMYSKFITNILSSLIQINIMMSSENNKKVSSTIECLRKAIVFNLNNKIDDIDNLKDEYPKIYNSLTKTMTIESEEESTISEYSYRLSLRYIKSSIDKLLLDIKRMTINKNITDWKKYFDDIEKDLKDIYNEIVGFEYITMTALMEQSAVDKIDKMRANSRINKIKIKSISDIPSQTYEVLKTLDEFYHLFIRTHYELLNSVSICDPDGTVSHFGEISKVHADIESYNDSDFGGNENDIDDIEDFIDTDD